MFFRIYSELPANQLYINQLQLHLIYIQTLKFYYFEINYFIWHSNCLL